MPLIYQKLILRTDLRANPSQYYVFGDNTERRGLRGQAAAMRGEPNAIGVATKWYPSLQSSAFFRDSQYNEIMTILAQDMLPIKELLEAGKTVVWPEDGIGTGLSAVYRTAPRIWAEMEIARKELGRMK